MDASYIQLFAKMELLFIGKKDWNHHLLLQLLNDLVSKNPGESDEDKNYKICVLKKRIIVHYHWEKYDRE